jgi:anti-sigma B factor antagonist
MDFDLSTRPAPPSAHLIAAGDLDIYSVRQVTSAVRRLLDQGCRDLTLDLSAVTFLDAAALGALIRAASKAHDLDGTFAITSAAGPVRRLCAMTGLGLTLGLAAA